MAESRGVGRGGARPGAGRPRNGESPGAPRRAKIVAARAVIQSIAAASAGSNPNMSATDLVGVAFATLEDVMRNSPASAPRVTAARAILDIAFAGKTAELQLERLGKKDIANANAEQQALGKFAVPTAPSMLQ
jgi:hypothetical protein